MALANQWILMGAGLVALSIVIGLVSSRFGAPLLLVFLLPVLKDRRFDDGANGGTAALRVAVGDALALPRITPTRHPRTCAEDLNDSETPAEKDPRNKCEDDEH